MSLDYLIEGFLQRSILIFYFFLLWYTVVEGVLK